jgi:hypothetical protein
MVGTAVYHLRRRHAAIRGPDDGDAFVPYRLQQTLAWSESGPSHALSCTSLNNLTACVGFRSGAGGRDAVLTLSWTAPRPAAGRRSRDIIGLVTNLCLAAPIASLGQPGHEGGNHIVIFDARL